MIKLVLPFIQAKIKFTFGKEKIEKTAIINFCLHFAPSSTSTAFNCPRFSTKVLAILQDTKLNIEDTELYQKSITRA